MFSAEEFAIINRLADENTLDPAALCAVIAIESGGKTSTLIDGNAKPLIRFEGHYFDRRLSGVKKAKARRQLLAHPSAGRIKNPRTQSARYKLLAKAQSIDNQAAIESTSWGLGQVMGAHWNWLGYASADALKDEALQGFEGQLRLMLRFIVKSNLKPKLRAQDWKGFARAYNGPNYRKNRYDTKLARAYARFKKAHKSPEEKQTAKSKSTLKSSNVLAFGATGEAIKTLQTLLTAKGFYCFQDGIFGKKTRSALKDFQTQNNLTANGIVDAPTQKALKANTKKHSLGTISKFFKRLGEIFSIGLNKTISK